MKKLFEPEKDFKLSRSKLELFLKCPRCFYFDRRLGISQPSGPAFTLNSAVDALLKNEFDSYRTLKKPHPLMEEHGIKAVPYEHEDINVWRENFKGITFFHEPTKLTISGAVDDVWEDEEGNLMIVDYKSTSTQNEISLDDQYKQAYKRQMEMYQWLFRQNKFSVSPIGYFVFANASKDRDFFGGSLEFAMQIISHIGDDSWVEKAVYDARACLESDDIPQRGEECSFCEYRKNAAESGESHA